MPMTAAQPQLDTKRMTELSEKLTALLMSYDRSTAMHTLMVSLPVYWSSGTGFDTVTEAVDVWRLASLHVEDGIRKCFGAIRYGDDDGAELETDRHRSGRSLGDD